MLVYNIYYFIHCTVPAILALTELYFMLKTSLSRIFSCFGVRIHSNVDFYIGLHVSQYLPGIIHKMLVNMKPINLCMSIYVVL